MIRTQKADQTRTSIIEAAKQLFQTKGYAGSSMTQVAEAASLGRRTVFLYFPTKQSLLRAALETDNEASLARMKVRAELSTADPVDYLVELIDGEMEYAALIEHLDLWRELAAANIQATRDVEMASQIQQYRANLFAHLKVGVERLLADGRLAAGAPVEALTKACFAAAFVNFHQLLSRNFAGIKEARADLTESVRFAISPYLAG